MARDFGPNKVAIWAITEDPAAREGIPSSLETAILLKRRTDDIFKANIDVRVDVSGFLFQTLQDALLDTEDDAVVFDPGASPLIPNDLAGHDLNDLGSIDLSRLCMSGSINPEPEILNSGAMDQTIKDLLPEENPAEGKPVEYEVKAWVIDLWGNKFPEVGSHEMNTPLCREDPSPGSPRPLKLVNQHQILKAAQRHNKSSKTLATLISPIHAVQSSVSKLTTFHKLKGLLNQPSFELLSDFFKLPIAVQVTRQHDRGGCEVFPNDEKSSKVYIIQTPFYSTGFWSLLLHTMVDNNVSEGFIKISGIIQVDADLKLEDIFCGIHKLVQRLGHHPTLLPLQLFVSHYGTTKDGIDLIQKEIGNVDKMLLEHLEEKGKLGDASKQYREMSMTLHKCSMDLAELNRRKKFEEELGNFLKKELKNDNQLKTLAEVYLRMSRSRESDLESLPGKIESQRNVLFNLITQHDSYLQARLASESLRDSKAMKTLSILTILFLPGAFIATVFSTNMFEFKTTNQQVRIYFAIVIPLTAVLMICWVLWLKSTPEGADEESARQSKPAVVLNGVKGRKAD
ncbi:uncharacterized protein FPRO_11512 [Fusarium proliferatum ET1]|uniref:Uncharacterized protein n=1 Tax=Fusarium proliferatum (strain ET1) TaxID=1227346 RepID=A0A1L7W086_FUSPR|nr:uncharacterized protein FPRO_11512 [Fusarium proliferatum ET1]CZR46065.1 uncharacterized protein FPRO_11512 [Fusarium proliferatum ET1]